MRQEGQESCSPLVTLRESTSLLSLGGKHTLSLRATPLCEEVGHHRGSSTGYALLGLLAVRSWNGYELTKQAQRSLHHVWPSSEAHLYREQKRLVRAGWARAEEEQVGNRTRNRYWITDAGRDALRSWLATEPEPPRIEIEGILRLFFADQGEIDAANASLIATAAHARDALDVMLDMIEDYVAAGGPFPERSYPIAAVCELITEMLERIEAHALNISEEISGADTLTSCSQQRTGQEKFEAILRRAGR